MTKQYLQFKVAEATKEKITIIASDETLDRYGEVVPLDAWDLKNYKSNPVLLVDHNYSMSAIVGRAKNLKVGDKEFTFEPEFHDFTQLAVEVKKMVEGGFAPAVSVGFIPHGPAKDGGKGSNELLEISFVAVPANPSALVLQNGLKSVKPDEENKIKEWVEKEAEAETAAAVEDEKTDDDKDGSADEKTLSAEALEAMSKSELQATCASLITELADRKEGRVLSGKTRDKISEGVTALKQAAAVLEEVLALSEDSNAGKGADNSKGRQTAVEDESPVPTKARATVLRVLQDINRDTNLVIAQLKK